MKKEEGIEIGKEEGKESRIKYKLKNAMDISIEQFWKLQCV